MCLLVTKLCPTLCNPWTLARQASVCYTISRSLVRFMSIESIMLSNLLILCCPLLLLPSIFPVSGPFQWVGSYHQVANILELQHQTFQCLIDQTFQSLITQGWFSVELTALVSLHCSLGDSQESFPASQFESINSSALTLLYGPTLTSMPDYWRNHSFDSTYLCQKSDVSAF